jgi:glutamine synthetase
MGTNGVLDVSKVYGSNVFNDAVMRERLPKETYKALQQTIREGKPLSIEVANVVANAMKDWALEHGATHYTHWFQPLTGSTAEKHESLISPGTDGTSIIEFSGKQLIQGEPDASSFPSGGLRSTFEARGYTAWDCTSPAFLKEDAADEVTLCIPTAFYSYHGEALDKKTPILRSMDAVSKQAIRVLRALGNTTSKRVYSTVGPEQEYFLIDKEYYDQRLDLISCGRTLFGAPSPKGQEMADQYFGSIKDRIAAFMKELDVDLWKMGVSAKTKHNEVAPAQYELAVVFSTTNIAADHNQLVMETMRKVALRHGLVCLLHEKPFAGVNGSGKHNNWSLATDDGINLLDPGHTPHENLQFLVFLAAMISTIDRHADKLRASVANAGNDHRLGANEAPPAIISAFLGTELTAILENIAAGRKVSGKAQDFIRVGVDTLPDLPKDNTDRNRTSPFAFTGNKFEFRMMPASMSISGANVVLNTIASEALEEVAIRLEKAKDLNKEATQLVKDTMKAHGRVIFNGNNYAEEWHKEAKRRSLPNFTNTVDALTAMATPEAVKLFQKYNILTKSELQSRTEIYWEQYSQQINIEALTAISMVKRQYIPAVIAYTNELADTITKLNAVKATAKVQAELLKKISGLLESASANLAALEKATAKAQEGMGGHGASTGSNKKTAMVYRDSVFPAMQTLRQDIDALEALLPADLWPVPTYAEMLFNL